MNPFAKFPELLKTLISRVSSRPTTPAQKKLMKSFENMSNTLSNISAKVEGLTTEQVEILAKLRQKSYKEAAKKSKKFHEEKK